VPSSRATAGFSQYCASTCARFGCTWHTSCVGSEPKKKKDGSFIFTRLTVYFSFFPTWFERKNTFMFIPIHFSGRQGLQARRIGFVFCLFREELVLTLSDTSHHPPRERGGEGASAPSCRAPHGHITDMAMTFDMAMSKGKQKNNKKNQSRCISPLLRPGNPKKVNKQTNKQT